MRILKVLAVAATVGMFLVLLMGVTVTNTGSAEGCGKSWPLCHGRFIPEYAFETMVEYSHRLVTGVVGLLLLAVAIGAVIHRRRMPEVKLLVPVVLFTLILQSGMGAWAVMYPQTPPVMALHFGISLVCLASVYVTTRVIFEADRRPLERAPRVPVGYRVLAGVALITVIGVAYLGAYLRHGGVELACHTWPLCNGQVFPGFRGPEGIAFSHRLAALGATGLMIALVARAARFRTARPDVLRVAVVILGLIIVQSLVGGAVVLTRLTFVSVMLHAGVMALMFMFLADLCRLALPPAHAVAAPAPAPLGQPALGAKA